MTKITRRVFLAAMSVLPLSAGAEDRVPSQPVAPTPTGTPLQISGIYPHLAAFNKGGECGIGAVVPWAGKLWYVTYPPHMRTGSDDKLREVDPGTMAMREREESVGGTHANRLVHRESNQLIIGPYFIDEKGTVRAVDVKAMPGRYTATARHLADPAGKVYFVDMEGPVWEVDVKTLAAKRLFVKPVPGWHSKGAYSGQGVLVQSNNGEHAGGGLDKLKMEGADVPTKPKSGSEDAGVLAEWNGTAPGTADGWKIISRRQHVEVTGPGGIYGNASDQDPIWSTGWDRRSVLLHVRDAKDNAWHVYRMPKASHTYDPSHGWYTEWPRIREIVPAKDGQPAKLMMTMHGGMFEFPPTFKPGQAAGIRQINQYLRYIPDFCHWNGQVVLASDDTSVMQNPMAGVSQSNLWFGKYEELATFGTAAGFGGVWLNDAVKAGQPSDPFLIAGYTRRGLHLSAKGEGDVTVTLEVDAKGDGNWAPLTKLTVPAAGGYVFHALPEDVKGEWVRLTADKDCEASAYFHMGNASWYEGVKGSQIFASIAGHGADAVVGGLVRPNNERGLSVLLKGKDGTETFATADERLKFEVIKDDGRVATMHKLLDPAEGVATADEASIVVQFGKSRFRLPRGREDMNGELPKVRQIREVESERNLINLGGIFYEAPRSGDNKAGAADWRNLKPIATHNSAITDYCTWRGLLVLAGTRPDAQPDGHYFKAAEGAGGVWLGSVDDLWKFGKPRGIGGPWKNTDVQPQQPSDPYLMAGFDRKSVTLSHDGKEPVTITIEADPTNFGFKPVTKVTVKPGATETYTFPDGFGAYWVRVKADKACKATATFKYE